MWLVLLAMLQGRDPAQELEWLRNISAGDRNSIAALYDRYNRFLYSFILAIVKSETDAQDVLQDVMIQVWERASSFNHERGNVYTWLVTIARTRAIDKVRSKGYKNAKSAQSEQDIEEIAGGDGSPLDLFIMEEKAAAIKNALKQIPAEQQEVIFIAYFGGLSQSEIAEQLDLPLGTVKTRMRQGMKKLQILLADLQ